MNNSSISPLKNMSPAELNAITDRIVYLRQDILRMSQAQFASTIKLSQTYLSLLENKRRAINLSTIQQISITFKVNLDWLIYGLGDDKNIFQSDNVTEDLIKQNLQSDVLHSLQNIYSLKDTEIDFIHWYLTLPKSERTAFLNALSTLRKYH